MKLNHPSISTEQGNQLVSLLPSVTLATQVSQRQNNPQSSERYTYHPVEQILQILPKTRDSQNMILYYQSCS